MSGHGRSGHRDSPGGSRTEERAPAHRRSYRRPLPSGGGPLRHGGPSTPMPSPSYTGACTNRTQEETPMGPKLVDYLLYEPEDSGILWIKFNRPDKMNPLNAPAGLTGPGHKDGENIRPG